MRALRICGPGAAAVATLDDPRPADGEVVVRVAATAVCGTDRKLVRRGAPDAHIPGHETAGYLDDGTAVGVHPDTGCGRCTPCGTGQTNRCPTKRSIGIDRDGGMAGLLVAPATHVVPLEGVAIALAPLLEPLACCVHAARRLGERAGPAVVVGAGAMGMLMTWVLQAAGHRVAVCQRSHARRELADQLGADVVMAPGEDLTARLDAPATVAVVTAPGAEPLQWALERVAEGGAVHAFAGSPDGSQVDANLVHYRHLDLVGSTGSGLVDYRAALDLVRSGAVPLDRLPRDTTDLDGAVDAVTTYPDDLRLRTMIEITGDDR